MAEEYSYQKKRTEFGRHAQFEDTDTRIVGALPYNEGQNDDYTQRNPNKIVLDNIPQLSEHRVSYTFLNFVAAGRLNTLEPKISNYRRHADQ